jgi:DNA-directed RNA polymerase specialized sigma24 family protein
VTSRELAVVELARRCREETLRFLKGEDRDDSFCFEIFKRAVVHRNDEAWESILVQYRGIVLAYISQHASAGLVRESEDFWVNRAFQRFWGAVSSDRFGQFPDLAALLKYLKLCVHSVLMDEMRSRRATSAVPMDELAESTAARTDAEGSVVGKLAGEQLWAVISKQVQDEAEQRVVFLSFARDMKPADIAERHPNLFKGVEDVYRIKRNVIERLRRSAEIRAFLSA